MDDEKRERSQLNNRSAQQDGDERGLLIVSDQEAFVGDQVTFKGRNLPADREYEVQWRSVNGRWGVLRAHEIVGTQFAPRRDTIATVETGDDGAFDLEWSIPQDYGGTHKVELLDGDSVVDRAEIEIIPWFELEETTAPLGNSFTLRGYGLGPGVMQNNYQVTWDNGMIGIMTGVMNRGTATAEIRAVGPPGEHVLEVWRNYRGVPYLLNNTQSPFGKVGGGRPTAWTVEVTEPEELPPAAWMDQLFDESPIPTHYPPLDEDTDAELSISPQCGQPGTDAIITGRSFPPNAEVDLVWYRHRGHEPRGTDSTPETKISAFATPDILPTVQADADGAFQVEVEIPRDIGSTRPITARVEREEVAVTGFMLQPKIERFEPTSGPPGTPIEIELSGIGWTNYENAPYFVYDNDPIGYLCGTGGDDEDGTVNPVLHAAGEPGYHFIDVYPSLFWIEEDAPDFELKPHLSYLDNHPVRPLPAMHFTFEVTE